MWIPDLHTEVQEVFDGVTMYFLLCFIYMTHWLVIFQYNRWEKWVTKEMKLAETH